MLVKLLTQTRYKGDTIFPDTEINVDDKTALRWEKSKIASIIKGNSGSPLEQMSAKELYALCLEKGIEVAEKQKKEVYLDLLKEAE